MDTFVVPRKRNRMRAFVSSRRNRRKFVAELYHFNSFLDSRYVHEAPTDAELLEVLRRKGAPETCHLISVDRELDGRDMALEEALEAVEAAEGTIVDCIPGRLAYYRGEDPGGRWILSRPST